MYLLQISALITSQTLLRQRRVVDCMSSSTPPEAGILPKTCLARSFADPVSAGIPTVMGRPRPERTSVPSNWAELPAIVHTACCRPWGVGCWRLGSVRASTEGQRWRGPRDAQRAAAPLQLFPHVLIIAFLRKANGKTSTGSQGTCVTRITHQSPSARDRRPSPSRRKRRDRVTHTEECRFACKA